jgi:hypothetical protein
MFLIMGLEEGVDFSSWEGYQFQASHRMLWKCRSTGDLNPNSHDPKKKGQLECLEGLTLTVRLRALPRGRLVYIFYVGYGRRSAEKINSLSDRSCFEEYCRWN